MGCHQSFNSTFRRSYGMSAVIILEKVGRIIIRVDCADVFYNHGNLSFGASGDNVFVDWTLVSLFYVDS